MWLWLAARLPLTSALRLHLLDCACPLKRMRDVVDAMQLIAGTSRAGDRYNARRGAMQKMVLEYDTAEASGCEIAPPRPIVAWARQSEAFGG